MAKYKQPSHNYKHTLFLFIIAVVVGVPIAVFSTAQKTETQQHASGFSDLNTAFAITKTNNTDGTMGPLTAATNYSNTFPTIYTGTLDFQVTDPPQAKSGPGYEEWLKHHPVPSNQSTNSTSGSANVRSDNSNEDDNKGNTQKMDGPQNVTALFVTISKVEVHLARVGLPGSKHTVEEAASASSQLNTTGQSTTQGNSNQNLDKWETLNIASPKTVDLVYLAKTHNMSSLGLTNLVNGLYTEVRLYITSAYATFQGSESPVQLVIPGKGNVVRIVQPFVINSGKPTTLIMDFDAQNSVIKAGSQYILKPVVAHMAEKN